MALSQTARDRLRNNPELRKFAAAFLARDTFRDADPFTGKPWGDVPPEKPKTPPRGMNSAGGWESSPCGVGPGDGASLTDGHPPSWGVLVFSGGTFGGATGPDGKVTPVGGWWFRERRMILRGEHAAGTPHEGNLFSLARELRWAGVRPTRDGLGSFDLDGACRLLGLDYDAVLATLAEMWEQVVTTPAFNTLTYCMKSADQTAPGFGERLGLRPTRARVAALAYHLGRYNRSGWAAFPRDRIAAWLGVCPHTAGRIIRELDAAGVIELRRGDDGEPAYSFKAREAREVRFLGVRHAVRDTEGDAVQGAAGRGDRVAAVPHDQGSDVQPARDRGQRRDVDVRAGRLGIEAHGPTGRGPREEGQGAGGVGVPRLRPAAGRPPAPLLHGEPPPVFGVRREHGLPGRLAREP
jgi:hypothetical protein